MSRRPRYLRLESIDKLNEMKEVLCNAIDHEMVLMHEIPSRIAGHLGTSPANISRVRNKRVEQLTFNQLFRYLVILRPDVKILVSSY